MCPSRLPFDSDELSVRVCYYSVVHYMRDRNVFIFSTTKIILWKCKMCVSVWEKEWVLSAHAQIIPDGNEGKKNSYKIRAPLRIHRCQAQWERRKHFEGEESSCKFANENNGFSLSLTSLLQLPFRCLLLLFEHIFDYDFCFFSFFRLRLSSFAYHFRSFVVFQCLFLCFCKHLFRTNNYQTKYYSYFLSHKVFRILYLFTCNWNVSYFIFELNKSRGHCFHFRLATLD